MTCILNINIPISFNLIILFSDSLVVDYKLCLSSFSPDWFDFHHPGKTSNIPY